MHMCPAALGRREASLCRTHLGSSAALRTVQRAGRRHSRAAPVRAAWGDEPEWHECKVTESSQAAIGSQRLVVDIGDLARGYGQAGQFVQLKVGDSKPAFMAIASPPSNKDSLIELLVKNSGDTAERLCAQEAGAVVSVSPVMGKGFPVHGVPAASVDRLFLFATGTGISPVKALIESGTLEAQARKQVRLYYGTFNPESTAYAKLAAAWREAGVEVVNVYSGEGGGYVQDAFRKEVDQLVVDGAATGGLVCGQKDMATAIRTLLTERGVTEERILANW